MKRFINALKLNFVEIFVFLFVAFLVIFVVYDIFTNIDKRNLLITECERQNGVSIQYSQGNHPHLLCLKSDSVIQLKVTK